jgi:hypothetical protein
MKKGQTICALAILALALVAVPGTATAATRLGPDLGPVQDGLGYGCQPGIYSPCAFVNLHSTNPAVPVAAPSNGVITSWRFRAGCCTDPQTESRTMTLKTFTPGTQDGTSGYSFIVPVRTGPSFVIPPGNQVISDPAVELPARLPIAAGERIGIVADSPIAFASYQASNMTATIVANNTFYNGEAYGVGYGTALAIGANVEPDTDGDGYGDETQDCHPNDPSLSGDCAPPVSLPPPPTLVVGKSGPCTGTCGGGGVTFSHAPQPIPSPRGDGGIVVALQCPSEATMPCGGILYAELPPGKSPRAAASAVKPTILASKQYSLEPGKKKQVQLIFARKTVTFLARKRTRRVIVTISPKGGQPVSTTKILKYPKRGEPR